MFYSRVTNNFSRLWTELRVLSDKISGAENVAEASVNTSSWGLNQRMRWSSFYVKYSRVMWKITTLVWLRHVCLNSRLEKHPYCSERASYIVVRKVTCSNPGPPFYLGQLFETFYLYHSPSTVCVCVFSRVLFTSPPYRLLA